MKNKNCSFLDVPKDNKNIEKYDNILEIFHTIKRDYRQRKIFINEQLFQIEQFLLHDRNDPRITYYDKALINDINLLTDVENGYKKPSKNKFLEKLEAIAFVVLSNNEYKNILETDKIIQKYNIQQNMVTVICNIKRNTIKNEEDLRLYAGKYRDCLIDILEIKKQIFESEQKADFFKVRIKKSKKYKIIELVNKHNYPYKRVADELDTTEQYVKNVMSKYRTKI